MIYEKGQPNETSNETRMVYGFRSGALLHTQYHGGIKEPG